MQHRNEFRRLAIWMISLGFAMGIVFPFFMVYILGVSQAIAFRPLVFALTIACGSTIGIANIALTTVVVRRRIRDLNSAMLRLAADDVPDVLPCAGNVDEFGEMSKSLAVFRDGLEDRKRLEAEQLRARQQARDERRTAMLELADSFERSVSGVAASLSDSASRMQGTAESMSSIAGEVTNASAAATSATDEASGNVQTVAAAAEELSASISEIRRQTAHASERAATAVSDIERTNERVKGLADAASRIGQVVALITDIAEQTNLLALNATIEAARAGEAGKGFAVVAGEVKNLANQTAQATNDISEQVAAIQSATDGAVKSIAEIGGVIDDVNAVTGEIAAAIEQQSAATNEIAESVMAATRGTGDAAANVSIVRETAAQAGEAANHTLLAARDLARETGTLQTEVERFLSHVRAG